MSQSKPKRRYIDLGDSVASTYQPRWGGAIEGYVVNYAVRNLWRVGASMELGDVVNEAYLVFDRCARKYPELDTPQHFMALFKTSWVRHFTDLSNADTATRAALVPIMSKRNEDGEEMSVAEPVGDLDNEGVLTTLVRQAPREVALVLRLFAQAPQELLELALASWNPQGKRHSAGSGRINALLGLPADFDAIGAVYTHFRGVDRISTTAAVNG